MRITTNLSIFLPILIIMATVCSGGRVMAAEEVVYKLVEKSDNFEVREYPQFLVAETFVSGEFDTAGSEGFRRLLAYIDGDNTKDSKIKMTAPVSQAAQSEKIPMTAPVGQSQIDGRWRITFAMPTNYTMETLPQPNDDRVMLAVTPPMRMATIRYSGSWSRSLYEEHEAMLKKWIAENNWHPAGMPVWARYDPPFLPWFLRRNEILIPIEVDNPI